VDHVMTMQNFGNMAPAYVTNSMRLLAERVMPQVRQRQASQSLRGGRLANPDGADVRCA
jgi:hypothetical protein